MNKTFLCSDFTPTPGLGKTLICVAESKQEAHAIITDFLKKKGHAQVYVGQVYELNMNVKQVSGICGE